MEDQDSIKDEERSGNTPKQPKKGIKIKVEIKIKVKIKVKVKCKINKNKHFF